MRSVATACCLAWVWTALGVPPAGAASWYESYDRAQAAIEQESWSEAVGQLNAALALRPNSGTRLRTYGMRFVDYFPYLELGVAYFHLGQIDAAAQALETEQRQGAIAASASGQARLASYLERIERARAEQAENRANRAPALVAASLASARELERQGRFEDALAALAQALAVAPADPEVSAARRRLLAAAAATERQQRERERLARLLREGRAELAAGRFRDAAARFGEALEIEGGDEARPLLAQAQERLRAALGGRPSDEERRRLLASALARAGELEAAGQLGAALAELQGAIALDPGSAEVRRLQERILRTQAATGAAQANAATIGQLLEEAERLLAAGELEPALRAANRVLVLDPAHGAALRQITRAYAKLSDALLAPDRAAPVVLVDGLPEGGGEVPPAVVRSPQLVLTGTVYDASPVAIQILAGGRSLGEGAVESRELQGVWITSFRWQHRLPVGLSELEVAAVDAVGNRATVRYPVRYAVPFVRSWRFPVALAAGLGAAFAGWRLALARRRRRLLRERFNPYVAGAPIVDQARFFGRDELLEYVLRRVSNNSIMLYGERRIGKTSFQHRLKRCLATLDDPVYEFHPVFIDLQGTPQEKFFGTLAAELFHELAPKLDGIEPSAPPRGDAYGYSELVKDIQRVLKALCRRTTKKVKLVLLIDEVDELNDYDPRINQRLRSLFMRAFADSLVSVVSGVAIKKQWEREGSPWYNFFQEIEIEPLDAVAARSLIESPVQGVFDFEAGVADEILRRTASRPYLIQRLCSALVDRLHEERRRRITAADLEAACRVEGL